MVEFCDAPDCEDVAERVLESGVRVCATHRKQFQRHGRFSAIVERPESARDRLFRAAIDLRDADSDDDAEFKLAERRFWSAFRSAAREHVVDHPEVVGLLVKRFLSPSGGKLRRK